MELRQPEPAPDDPIDAFIMRWAESSAAERANFQSFAVELCDVLGVGRPEPATADAARDRYRFEYPVKFHHPDGSTSAGSIDLYKRDAFVMEAKQGLHQRLRYEYGRLNMRGHSDASSNLHQSSRIFGLTFPDY